MLAESKVTFRDLLLLLVSPEMCSILGPGKSTYPLFRFLQCTLCYFPPLSTPMITLPACDLHYRVTSRQGVAESTLALAESGYIDLPWPLHSYQIFDYAARSKHSSFLSEAPWQGKKSFVTLTHYQLDPSLMTESGIKCFDRFFKAVNCKENKLIAKRRAYLMDDMELIGMVSFINHGWTEVDW